VLIVALQHDEGFTAGTRGWPFQRDLNEARITRDRERGASKEEREGKEGGRDVHGSRTSTRSIFPLPMGTKEITDPLPDARQELQRTGLLGSVSMRPVAWNLSVRGSSSIVAS
jgi:hypothetical protein